MDIEALNTFLGTLAGSKAWPPLLVRDPDSPVGWREWTAEDSEALLECASGEMDGGSRGGDGCRCFNQQQLAEVLGMSVPTVMGLIRREDHPIPHIRQGRRILVPGLLLEEWLREEASRK